MKHDGNGSNDDSGNHANSQANQDEKRIARANDVEIEASEHDVRFDGEDIEEKTIVAAQQIALHQEYEGILPHPKQFNEYSPNAQEVLLEIAREQVKAAFIDESIRQNKLVEAEIKQGYRGQILSTIIICLTIIAAIAVVVCTGNIAVATLMVGIPLVSIIGNLFKPSKSRQIKTKE